MRYKDVLYWSRRALKRFKLGGFLVLESSPGSYHVVFDRSVNWSENMRIVAWVALLSRRGNLRRWFLMQCIKQKSTLRVSNKHEMGGVVKYSPKIIYHEGSQDYEIADYLDYRELIFSYIKENARAQSIKARV
jgi:hypothetical protein